MPWLAGVASGSAAATVAPAAATHFVLTPDANVSAGTAFNVMVTAYDAFGNVATGYTGTVHFVSNLPPALRTLPDDYTFTAGDAGRHSFPVTFDRVGTWALGVTDVARPLVRGGKLVAVAAGALDHFALAAFPLTTVADVTHVVTITAYDAFNNRVTGYLGTVQFSSSDTGAVLPGPYTFTAHDAGQHTFALTLMDAGTSQWLKVEDQADTSHKGELDGITIKAP
jgi:hypothetical protein